MSALAAVVPVFVPVRSSGGGGKMSSGDALLMGCILIWLAVSGLLAVLATLWDSKALFTAFGFVFFGGLLLGLLAGGIALICMAGA